MNANIIVSPVWKYLHLKIQEGEQPASSTVGTQAFTFTCSWFAMWLYLLFCRGTTAVVSSEAWPLIQWTTGERDAEETVCPVFNKLSQPMSFRFPPLEVLYERICRLCFCWGAFSSCLATAMIIILFFLSHNRDPRVSVGATAARDDHDNRCSINYNIRVQADIRSFAVYWMLYVVLGDFNASDWS